MFMYFFPLSTYSCGQKFTYTHYGYEYHGNLFWLFNDLFELFYFWGVMILIACTFKNLWRVGGISVAHTGSSVHIQGQIYSDIHLNLLLSGAEGSSQGQALLTSQ